MPDDTVLSVRGEARTTVAPDYATVHCGLRADADSKPAALALVRRVQNAVLAALQGLGGVALTADTGRAALTWSVGSVQAYEREEFNKATGTHGPAGQIMATAPLAIAARDLSLLADVTRVLGDTDGLEMHGITWGVDADNPAWPGVRADAIAAAIAKGRDYAAALGGAVHTVAQLADPGLLSGEQGVSLHAAAASGGRMLSEGGAMPSLDPVPQELYAVVEARLLATVPPIDARPVPGQRPTG